INGWDDMMRKQFLISGFYMPNFSTGNPANDIAETINKNRTAQRLRHLNTSPGLGCMALQYIEECKGNCTDKNTVNCRPKEDDFVEVFAPNCGVELPTFGTISGRIVGCHHHKYLDPLEAFSQSIVDDERTLSALRNRTHSEVGVGVVRTRKGIFWCVLFSSSQTNSSSSSSFVLEDRGEGIKQKEGCFSGTSIPCSRGPRRTSVASGSILAASFLLYIYLL
ncbi:hypothetical protein U1Q18_023005, partial [Sarracenia purpurea var. burkii]